MYHKNRFEGDIINPGLTSRSVKSFVAETDPNPIPGIMRNAVRQTYLMWTDARIPYTISSQYSSFSRSKIAEAIEEYRRLTCIDFAPKSAADQDYIHIVPDDGCYSLVGRVGGKQPVSLGDGCIQKGIIIHELMHAVGFFHEQSRADRDDYVIIHWENVETGLQDQFDKYSLSMIDHLGTKYDYGSVMHYAPTAFSKNGKATIEPRKKGAEIGQRVGFSETDLYKVNKLYKCPQLVNTFTPDTDSEVVTKKNRSSTATTVAGSEEENFIASTPITPINTGTSTKSGSFKNSWKKTAPKAATNAIPIAKIVDHGVKDGPIVECAPKKFSKITCLQNVKKAASCAKYKFLAKNSTSKKFCLV
uniref:Metalloendopeptidase n=1 Tax=Acrobeloides nanus TaxID=290746 RepID=A0A914EE62_9BILA